LRTDNGKEYLNDEILTYIIENGITLQLTVPYTPQQNGRAEVLNKHLLDMVRSMLIHAHLPFGFWGEAIQHAVYIHNRTIQSGKTSTPMTMCFSKNPDLEKVKVFGCKVEFWLPAEKREKLDEKTHTGIYLGSIDEYHPNETNITHKAYRLYDLKEMAVVYSRDCKFYESDFPYEKELLYSLNTTYTDALNSNEKEEWRNAINTELKNHEKNETWDIVNAPEGVTLIKLKWVLTVKKKADGTFDKHKARLVACGFPRIKGIDYQESFSPTPKPSSIKLFITNALNKNWKITQLDVKSAFLNGVLEAPVYCVPKEEMNVNNGKVIRLKKALYGLQEAGRQWFQLYKNTLINIGFKQLEGEPCYFIKTENGDNLHIIIYIDDQLLAGSEWLINNTIQKLNEVFQMENLGEISSYLGIKFLKGDHSYMLHQEGLINQLLQKFELENAAISYVPLGSGIANIECDKCDDKQYRQIIGSLMYIATSTRPDIMFSVSWLSRFLGKSTTHQFKEAKRVIRYLKGTINYSTKLRSMKNMVMQVFVDADYANGEDYKSTTGCLIFLDNCLVSWFSRKQNLTSLSTTESEFTALGEAIREVLYLTGIIREIGIVLQSVNIYCDNQSAIKIAKSQNMNARTKHFGVINRIRDHLNDNDFNLEYISSDENLADLLTKPLKRVKFKTLRDQVVSKHAIDERECYDAIDARSN
jgi:hypothetical protein